MGQRFSVSPCHGRHSDGFYRIILRVASSADLACCMEPPLCWSDSRYDEGRGHHRQRLTAAAATGSIHCATSCATPGSLLFLIPGSGCTPRVNGHAQVSADPDSPASFSNDGKAPRTVMTVDEIYFKCARAHCAFRPAESGQARRPQELADTGTDPRRHGREPRRR